ncbi:MAG TPA: undecaprenyldiphospho-muramoylpentapeptide beta-N-acetylglucosaminyltransferase [Deltaproteobacteria bacterium]|nr:undecaprenyldiphospho-muramoylpentapeptide beta-N-acetylglucosaminyltransferase [Deltaproteobacteria bacterium]HPR55867.1 undecaprenyldiphospho-muramoylpentapeptide beta-N-acetylglucosaminyltransferase [Deltaproteobacteria bacterium]HXK48773.1 undecaprenyldiphospho-muramoylpentapeptide beta-N-acetylglucosaminyltransferase [Deltaproteobacteria bacterium]
MKVLVTAGGTGGHIMPAVAIAEAIRAAGPDTGILFVGTDRGMEERIAELNHLDFVGIPALGIKGKSVANLARAVLVNTRAFLKALNIVRGFRPDWVIGTGGYVTGMVVLAGRLLGCTCAVQEQNTIPGLTNRLLSRIAHRVFLSFPDTRGRFPATKTRLVGNPLRKELTDTRSGSGDHLLILGGSLGATSINRAAVGAVRLLKGEGMELSVIHQCGTRDHAWVSDAYREMGLDADVRAFIDDMAGAYRSARLAVSRCGGITLAELSCTGLPAIMIPFPHATDDHQTENGRYVANNGGGWLIPDAQLTPERLAREIRTRLGGPEGLARASGNMTAMGLGAGGHLIAQEIMRV